MENFRIEEIKKEEAKKQIVAGEGLFSLVSSR